jgi:hypothetical protein
MSPTVRHLAGFGRGYLLRRYGVLRGRAALRCAALRTVVTEGVVVAAEAPMAHDLAPLRGRVAGWRAGASYERRPWPPAEAIDAGITFWGSLTLRRASRRAGA